MFLSLGHAGGDAVRLWVYIPSPILWTRVKLLQMVSGAGAEGAVCPQIRMDPCVPQSDFGEGGGHTLPLCSITMVGFQEVLATWAFRWFMVPGGHWRWDQK